MEDRNLLRKTLLSIKKDLHKQLAADHVSAPKTELEKRLREIHIKDGKKMLAQVNRRLLSISPLSDLCTVSFDDKLKRAKEVPIEPLLPHPVRHEMTRCPFHDDKHPSMKVNSNYVYCFTCNEGWDTIAFIQKLKGMTFIEAVDYLNRGML